MDCLTGLETPDVLLQGPSQLFCGSDPDMFPLVNGSSASSSTVSSSNNSLTSLQQLVPSETFSSPNAFHAMTNIDLKNCPLISITRSDVFGRFIIAKEDIPAGKIIVSEPPSAFGPDGEGCEGYEIPLCLGCCMIMNDENEDIRCSKCKWPVCSEQCEISEAHSGNECKFFVERGIKFPPEVDIASCYKGIQILRGMLLRDKYPEKWDELMQLQDWTELDCTSRDFSGLDKFRSETLGLTSEIHTHQWSKLLGIFNVNSFSFIMKSESEDRSPSFAEFVFVLTSFFSHSCAPNANWAIGCSPDFIMQVRATVDIKKGEMITVPYNYDHVNFGTYGRVIRQQSFNCKCRRCLDPTELETYNSAIKCYKCHDGLVLPLNPVDVKSEWKCRRCCSVFSGDLVILFVEALSDEVENCDTVEDLEKFIVMHSDKTLHPNHWVLNLASNSILSHLADCLPTLTSSQLERFLGHCFYVLQILNVLAPGVSLFRGNVLLQISRALLAKTELYIREGHLSSKATISEQMKQVYSYQQAALLFWKDDHSYRPRNETYGPEAKDLIQEMSRVKNQYLNDSQE